MQFGFKGVNGNANEANRRESSHKPGSGVHSSALVSLNSGGGGSNARGTRHVSRSHRSSSGNRYEEAANG